MAVTIARTTGDARVRKFDELSAFLGLGDQPDRRRQGREQVQIDARLVSDDLWCAIDCQIVDRSAHGARLSLPWPIELPAQFQLVIPSEEATIPVRCVWHRNKLAGVEFLRTR